MKPHLPRFRMRIGPAPRGEQLAGPGCGRMPPLSRQLSCQSVTILMEAGAPCSCIPLYHKCKASSGLLVCTYVAGAQGRAAGQPGVVRHRVALAADRLRQVGAQGQRRAPGVHPALRRARSAPPTPPCMTRPPATAPAPMSTQGDDTPAAPLHSRITSVFIMHR